MRHSHTKPPTLPALFADARHARRCLADGQFQHAVGLALECRRLDKLHDAVARAGTDAPACLAYALRLCQSAAVSPRQFRVSVLRALVPLLLQASNSGSVGGPDVVAVCQCLQAVGDPAGVAAQLEALCSAPAGDGHLVALQVAFDLFENDQPEFLGAVAQALSPHAAAAPPPADGATAMETETPADSDVRVKLRRVLSGEVPMGLHLAFSSSRNAADVQLLKTLKASVEPRNSVCHGAVVAANGIAHCGTTCDTFLRENLDWLGRATNWAKFSATASLGAIHKGHVTHGRALMAPYLPREGGGGSGSPYAEGGALYALGLIYAQHGTPIRSFLAQCLRNASSEVVQHGACLGLGLAAMAIGADDEDPSAAPVMAPPPAADDAAAAPVAPPAAPAAQSAAAAAPTGSALFEDLKAVLYTDSAVAGEAAGLAMGLLLAGRASDKVHEMVAYAHDTSHEKIIRGLAVGLALTCYGREEEAQPLIETLFRDADPLLRYGGAFAVGLAYRGTGHNAAVSRLLHAAVSDVSDDVRRAAVMSLGFVLAGQPEQVPQVVALLAESYNPHVRYGAAMALGLGCCATGNKDALALLEPLASDGTDFVRQGAHIATALLLLQQPEGARVGPFRRQLDKVIADKHEDALAKMGAILAAGILDAGGRNATLALRSHSGAWRSSAFLGLALFVQHWYWYPLVSCLSVALSPSAMIGVTPDLVAPVFTVTSAAKPSTFAYALPVSATATKEVTKAAAAVLSTTAKAKAKQIKKEAEKKAAEAAAAAAGGGAATAMDTGDAPAAPPPAGGDASAPMDADGAAAAPAAKVEESHAVLSNPCRVVPAQERLIRWDEKGRYQPIKRAGAGILIVRDSRPDEHVEVALRLPEPTPAAPAAAAEAATPAAAPLPALLEEEPVPPEAFEYVEEEAQ